MLDEERSAVRGRDGDEKEVAGTEGVELFKLDNIVFSFIYLEISIRWLHYRPETPNDSLALY